MRFRIVSASCALLLLPLIVAAGENPTDDGIAHGTINIAIGNKNGLVVLTDSMITVTDATGTHQQQNPGQKLFKLDDRTVCSFAGFASAPAGSPGATMSDLNTNTSAIIHEYVRQSAHQKPQSIVERLRGLAFLLNLHLSTIANVRDALRTATGIELYRFQLIVAGYDIDDKPKIGRITLQTKNENGSFISDIEDARIWNVEEGLIWKLNGMPDVATQLLLHPESGPKDDPVLRAYATSIPKDGGRSLTVEQMVELAKKLAYYTSRAHPEVGGPSQVAIFQRSNNVSIEQLAFPEPPRPLVHFILMVDGHFDGMNSIRFGPEVAHIIAIRCSWDNVQRELDGNYYIGNVFANSVLTYDGGIVNLGDTNRVFNSALAIMPHARLEYEDVRRLTATFSWSRVGYAVPRNR